MEVVIERAGEQSYRTVVAVRWRAWVLCMCLTPWALACSGSADQPVAAQPVAGATSNVSPMRVRDTTGSEFEFVAPDSDTVRSLEGLAPECRGTQFTEFRLVRGNTGLAMVCSIDPRSDWPSEFTCRPVACDQQAKCPAEFGCEQGLCQCQASGCKMVDGGGRIHSVELTARCLAAKPRFARCLDGIRDSTWARLNEVVLTMCDGEGLCTIPDDCR